MLAQNVGTLATARHRAARREGNVGNEPRFLHCACTKCRNFGDCPTSSRQARGKCRQRAKVPDEFYFGIYDELYDPVTLRNFDSGHLIGGPVIGCVRYEDKIKIYWRSNKDENKKLIC